MNYIHYDKNFSFFDKFIDIFYSFLDFNKSLYIFSLFIGERPKKPILRPLFSKIGAHLIDRMFSIRTLLKELQKINTTFLLEEDFMTQQNEVKWYTIVVMPSQEISIRNKLLSLAKNKEYEGLIEDVRCITYMKENKNGEVKEKVHPVYTQYVFVRMVHTNTTYNAIKISGVRTILGGPTPMEESEATRLFEATKNLTNEDVEALNED